MAKQKIDLRVLYGRVEALLPKKITSSNKKKVLLDIKELSNEIRQPFQILIWNYLDEGLIINDKNIEYFYNEIFRDELKKDSNPVMYHYFYIKFNGLEDLATLDMENGTLFKEGNVKKILLHSQYDTPVLIVGETGTSKSIAAKIIHSLSKRKDKRFLNINIVAYPENLFIAELCGYEKGAFTGAINKKVGLLEEANNGTVFLDELGKLEPHLQAKLLKIVEEKIITPLGSSKSKKIDVRFIAALQPEDIKQNKIIPDLKYRLGYPDLLELPSLNKRLLIAPETVIKGSLREALKKLGISEEFSASNEAVKRLTDSTFNGNYRELESILGVAVKLARLNKRNEILPEDLKSILKKDAVKTEETATEKSFSTVMLKDIISLANEKKVDIVKFKLNEIYAAGKDLKNSLSSEGIKGKHYYNVRAKLERIVGKKFMREVQKIPITNDV